MTAPDPCLRRLAARARRNRFLMQADERPRLERLLADLEATLAAGEAEAARPLQEVLHELGNRCAEVLDGLAQIRGRIEQAFVVPMSDAGRELEAVGDSVVRSLRAKQLQLLASASPDHDLVRDLLKVVEEQRSAAVATLAGSLWLLEPRRDSVPRLPGASLYDSRVGPVLPQLCRSPLLSRWRLHRLLRALHRDYHLIEIDVREIVAEIVLSRTDNQAAALLERHATTHKTLEDRIADGWRALRHALESAVVELAEAAASPAAVDATAASARVRDLQAVTLAGVEQAVESIRDAETIYASVLEGIVADIGDDRQRCLKAARRALGAAGSLRGRVVFSAKALHKSARMRLRRLRESGRARLAFAQGLGQAVAEHGGHALLRLGNRLGFGGVSEEQKLAIADLPWSHDLVERIRTLPAIYRRLFSARPLQSSELLVGQDDTLATLREAYARWCEERGTRVAIVGGEGTGKSSLLNCFENEIATDADLLHIDIDRRLRTADDVVQALATGLGLPAAPRSVADLVAAVGAGPRRLVVVHRAHNLFLRTVGGTQAPRTFAEVLLATSDRLLWVSSWREYPWRRLDHLFGLARHFTHVIEAGLTRQADLREAILRRQRTTGDTLVFADHEIESHALRRLRRGKAVDSPATQAALSERYFDTLFRVSGGNIEAAFYFWLLSLGADAPGRLVVRPVLRLDDRLIRSLDRLDHFTLTELIGHGYLSADEHAEIFRIDTQRSRLVLQNLLQQRLVEPAADGAAGAAPRYRVSTVFQQTVIGVLTDMNFLY